MRALSLVKWRAPFRRLIPMVMASATSKKSPMVPIPTGPIVMAMVCRMVLRWQCGERLGMTMPTATASSTCSIRMPMTMASSMGRSTVGGATPPIGIRCLRGGITLFEDDFQRANAGVVGNGWVEVESSSRTRIVNGRLVFDANNDSFRPLIRHAFPAQSSGDIVWTFNLNFQRTGPENDYSFWMQLGNGASMSDTNPMEQGVAVNLIWGSPSHGLTTHEGLGYVAGGTVKHVATVRGGSVPITVLVVLASRTYSVSVAGQQIADKSPLRSPSPPSIPCGSSPIS